MSAKWNTETRRVGFEDRYLTCWNALNIRYLCCHHWEQKRLSWKRQVRFKLLKLESKYRFHPWSENVVKMPTDFNPAKTSSHLLSQTQEKVKANQE